MDKYDIYIARVQFRNRDGTSGEERTPVVIIDPNRNLVLVAKCTHHWVRKWNQYDYEIQKPTEAGLHQDSVIMFDYLLELNSTDIFQKIGHLDSYDIQYIEPVLSEILG